METSKAVQLLVLLTQLTTQLPALIQAFRATFSEEDEAALQAELVKLRDQNEAAYVAAHAALEALAVKA